MVEYDGRCKQGQRLVSVLSDHQNNTAAQVWPGAIKQIKCSYSVSEYAKNKEDVKIEKQTEEV